MSGMHDTSELRLLLVLAAACCAAGPQAAPGPRPAAALQRQHLPPAVIRPPIAPVMDVPPIDRAARADVAAAAARIDRLVDAQLSEHGVPPAPELTAEQFVRRAYLEIAGRIPALDDVEAFLDDDSPARRTELVERLLTSPDYVSHFYNWWADILRLAERPQKLLPFEPYLFYVKESIRTNKPYDEWIREMLAADGRLWENPAVGFQLRDLGMPLPYVDNTVRVLLGTQIGCAQCHDHPFDGWTRRQFYELAALTAGTRTRPGQQPPIRNASRDGPPAVARHVRRLIREVRTSGDPRAGALAQFVVANATEVRFQDVPLRLPADYQYDDAEPGSTVEPRVLWGAVPAAGREAAGRARFAAWVTDHDNRQFARTIANRLWKKLMGVGLVEPVDDFREGNPPSHPELLELLTDEMLRVDFDLREFVRLLVSTRTWRRQAAIHDPTGGVPFRYPGPALRRMTAEQLWDSILTLVARNPWAVQRPSTDDVAAAFSLDLRRADLDDVRRQFETYVTDLGPRRSRHVRRLQENCGYRGQFLVRASELPAPLPLGHFLRQFGQSDREAIEGGRQVATVPQILAMFNGPITHAMLEPGSVIHEEVTSRDPREAVDTVFLAVLARRPSAEDRELALGAIDAAESRAIGCGNLIWALLNTREFLFIQ